MGGGRKRVEDAFRPPNGIIPEDKGGDRHKQNKNYIRPFVTSFAPIPRFDKERGWSGTYEEVFGKTFNNVEYLDPVAFRKLSGKEPAKCEGDFSKDLKHNKDSNAKHSKYIFYNSNVSIKQIKFCKLWNSYIGRLRLIPSDRQMYDACLYFIKLYSLELLPELRLELGYHIFNLVQHHILSSVQAVHILQSADRFVGGAGEPEARARRAVVVPGPAGGWRE